MRLSDLYEKKDKDACLELTATVININLDKNRDLMERCKPLMEYSIFVSKVKEYIVQFDDDDNVQAGKL